MGNFQFAKAKAQLNGASQSEGGLMSAADKEKLDGIEAGAQVNPGNASSSSDGLMSSSDKTKLDGIDAGAQVNPSNATIVNLIYPVGSIYMSVNNTSPATLFGGTWSQLKDRFLLGAGDTYTNGNTGGAASVSYTPAGTNSGGAVSSHTLTTDQIPSHNHTFTGSAVTSGGQSQGHTHTFTTGNQSQDHTHTGTSGNPNKDHTHSGPSHTHTGPSHTHTGPSHTHTGPNHMHGYRVAYRLGGGALYTGEGLCGSSPNSTTASEWNGIPAQSTHEGGTGATGSSGTGNTGAAGTGATGAAGTGATGSVSQWHTHSTTTGGVSKNHTHSGTSDGVSQGHTHSVTAAGTIGSTGGGKGHSHGFTQPTFTGKAATIATMPPYLVVYMWKRTA